MIFLLRHIYIFGLLIIHMAKTAEEIAFLKQTFGEDAVKDIETPIAPDAKVEDTLNDAPEDKKEETSTVEQKDVKSVSDLSDEELIEIINKKKGISLKSFDELLPKEDPAVAAEKRDAKKIATAFEKGWMKKSEYENYISDRNKKEDIVFSDFAEYAKSINPDIADDEIKYDFDDAYGLSSDEDSLRYKIGQRKIEQMSELLLKKKYASYFDIDNKFSQYESELTQREQEEKNIISQAPAFKKNVEDAIVSFSKMTFSVDDKTSYEVEIPKDVLDSVKKSFLDKDFVINSVKSGMDKDDIRGSMEIALMKQSLPTILKSLINKDRLEYAKRLQGVPSTFSLKTDVTPNKKVFSDKEKEYLKRIGMTIPESTN